MKRFNKVFLSLVLVLILAVPMLAGCSLFNNSQSNTDNTNSQKKDLETTIVDCRRYNGNYYYILNFKNNTENDMTFYSDDFFVKGIDKRDGHVYATFQVYFYNYEPAESNPYKSCGSNFIVNNNSNKTMAIMTSIYVYGDFSDGVTLALYHNQVKIASFDTDDGVITNIK